MPTLSVILPNHNHAAELPRALDALLPQLTGGDELIVVDDGSTDGSVAVLETYAGRFKALRLFRHEHNRGVVAAIETGLGVATGDWVYGAGADDKVRPRFFDDARRAAERHPDAGVLLADVMACYDDHRTPERQAIPAWSDAGAQWISPERFLEEHLWPDEAGLSLGAGTLYRRAALEQAGGFRSELGPWCDTFAARALALRHGCVYLDRVGVEWTVHASSYSHQSGLETQRMAEIGQRCAALMRSPAFAELFPEEYTARWESRWMLEMAGGYERLDDLLVPTRLRDVRRAYAQLGQNGRWFDRLLSGALRLMFAVVDRRRETLQATRTSPDPSASSSEQPDHDANQHETTQAIPTVASTLP